MPAGTNRAGSGDDVPPPQARVLGERRAVAASPLAPSATAPTLSQSQLPELADAADREAHAPSNGSRRWMVTRRPPSAVPRGRQLPCRVRRVGRRVEREERNAEQGGAPWRTRPRSASLHLGLIALTQVKRLGSQLGSTTGVANGGVCGFPLAPSVIVGLLSVHSRRVGDRPGRAWRAGVTRSSPGHRPVDENKTETVRSGHASDVQPTDLLSNWEWGPSRGRRQQRQRR